MAETKYASFAPENIKESGSNNLWNNADATITGFRFTKDTPPGYTITPKVINGVVEELSPIGVFVDFEIVGNSPVEERRVDQFYSVGAKVGLSFDIAAGGMALVPKTEDAQLYSSNFTKFAKSLVENGLPLPVVASGDFSKIVGLQGHFKRIEQKDANPRKWTDKKGVEHTEQPTVLLCTRVIALPKAGAAGTTTTAVASEPAGDFNLDVAAQEVLVDALKAKKKPIQRSQIVLLVSQQATAAGAGTPAYENRAVIAKRAAEEEFLTMLAGLDIVAYDAAAKGQPVSLPAAA